MRETNNYSMVSIPKSYHGLGATNVNQLSGRKTDSIVEKSFPHYIAIEGPIGVGKTTLAKRLANTFGYELLEEQAEMNPFLERFYQNRKQTALAMPGNHALAQTAHSSHLLRPLTAPSSWH